MSSPGPTVQLRVAQNKRARATQALVFGSICQNYQGAILVHVFEPPIPPNLPPTPVFPPLPGEPFAGDTRHARPGRLHGLAGGGVRLHGPQGAALAPGVHQLLAREKDGGRRAVVLAAWPRQQQDPMFGGLWFGGFGLSLVVLVWLGLVWWFGGLVVWRFGGLAVWRFGFVSWFSWVW